MGKLVFGDVEVVLRFMCVCFVVLVVMVCLLGGL